MKMAETALLEFGKLVLGQLGSLAVDELKLALGLEDEVDSIKSNLSSIQAVLRDAEKQQRTSEVIKNWLGKLEDVMYDIDDLLDDITTEVKLHAKNKGEFRKQVRKFFSRTNSLVLRSQWAHQIQSLCKKLDRISSERKKFVLSTEVSKDLEEPASRRETHSKPSKSDLILGREDDKEAIINSILNCGDHDSLSVVPIVGIGGVGKTTLAQLVYNDVKIDDSFKLKLWVYVSEKFRIKKVMKQIISMVTGESIAQLTIEEVPLESLRMKMSNALREKKYLLVLDDLWNEDSNEWRKLRELLDVGAKGSTVVVTTRGSKVASITHTLEECKLEELSHEDSLQIFKQFAFKDGGEKVKPVLLDLANTIVEMSKGLPLVVTTLGKLLHGETNEEKWGLVIQKLEHGDEEILNVLKLSYDQLTSSSKPCFRFLPVIKDTYGDMGCLLMVAFWIALGYIPSDGHGVELGSMYVEELLSKSLMMESTTIQSIVEFDYFREFCLHDLVYDLAKSVIGEEYAKINCGTEEVSEKVRYIVAEEDELLGKQFHQGMLHQGKKARLFSFTADLQLSKTLIETIISSFPLLRVLDLAECQFENLPRTIGYMKHLRYLTLSGNQRIKHLPSSICNLINLQTLFLDRCINLQDLPTEIGRLENLIFLSVTTHEEALPESIGQIKGLRFFSISTSQKLASLPMNINHLEKLDCLAIEDCEQLDLQHGSLLPESLKSLKIVGVPKFHMLSTDLPFTSLKNVVFDNCEGLIELGDWTKHLISLETLRIVACPNLLRLPHTLPLLDNMKYLIIEDCPLLSERCKQEKGEDWHLISNIPQVYIDDEIIIDDGVIW